MEDKNKEDVNYCHYSDLPSPMAYDKKFNKQAKEGQGIDIVEELSKILQEELKKANSNTNE